jgi:hypothetical protein
VPSKATGRWKDKAITTERLTDAKRSLTLALDRVNEALAEPYVEEVLDLMADADTHADMARQEIEAAFRGIES